MLILIEIHINILIFLSFNGKLCVKLNVKNHCFYKICDVESIMCDNYSMFSYNDKLSMVNTLVQMQNVTSYPFMHSCLRFGTLGW